MYKIDSEYFYSPMLKSCIVLNVWKTRKDKGKIEILTGVEANTHKR